MPAPHPGQWEILPYMAETHSTHLILLRTGKLLYFHAAPETGVNIVSKVWDPTGDPSISTRIIPPWTGTETDLPYLFCSGHNFLSDGRALVAGGHRDLPVQWDGLPYTYIFDPIAIDPQTGEPGTWIIPTGPAGPHKMNDGRWYPTLTYLGEKKPSQFDEIMVVTGYRYDQPHVINPEVEFYDPNRSTGWSVVNNNMDRELNLYVGAQLIAYGPYAGEIFYDLIGWNPEVQGVPQAYRFDPQGPGGIFWNPAGQSMPFYRNMGNSVHLPIFPNSQSSKVMNFAGAKVWQPLNTSEVIDLNSPSPQWNSLPTFKHKRYFANSPILPDSRILLVGGNRSGNFNEPEFEPELFDSETMQWLNWDLAQSSIPRGYHSSGILLEDARVWVSGGEHSDPEETMKIEIYSPGYLFEGTRPNILNAPTNISYGQKFGVLTDSPIGSIALISPGAVTHGNNMSQRYIGLNVPPAEINGGYGYNDIFAPANRNIAPPGYYMLFVCRPKSASTSGEYRIPSVAHWVKLS